MTKILVTGAAGFLGFHLARELASRPNTEVVCVDNFTRGEPDSHYRDLIAQPNVTGLECDLSVAEQVSTLPDDVEYVYHLAALNGTQNFYERPLEVIRSCTLPTIFLADKYGRAGGLRRFVYAGTSEAYACTVTRFDWEVPTSEDVPLSIDDVFNPRWSYGASKLHGEIVTAQAGRAYNMPISIVRYHNAYGPRMGDKHVVPDFYDRARRGVFELFGFEDTRSFMYVDDSIRATILVAETEACAQQIVNVGSETEIKILDLAETMMRVRGFRGEIVKHASPPGSVKRRAPNTRKLRQLTGFQESVSLESGLEATARFYLDDQLVGPL
jgi:nucleoside-diphosphate-sugar epimerase